MKKRMILLLLILVLIPLFGCTKYRTIEGENYYFGTIVRISIKAEKDKSYEHFEKIEEIFTHYDKLTDSYTDYKNNVYAINHSEEYVVCDKDLIDLLNICEKYKEETNGHFNILVGSACEYYKKIIDGYIDDVDNELINQYLFDINNTKIIIDGNRVKLEGNAKIDLGAIAKGYALSKVKEYILENNISEYLINCGSSSLSMGAKNGDYYIIGIKYDESNKVFIKNLDLGCSSSNEQYNYIKGEKIHHIINPLTCTPDNTYEAIYLIGDDSIILDCFSTAFMSMDISEIKTISNKYNLHYIVYKNDGSVYKSIDGNHYDSETK